MDTKLYMQFRKVKVTKRGKEIFDLKATMQAIRDRLEYLRGEIQAERISYAEIAELQELKAYIDPADSLLLEWAGVPEGSPKPGDYVSLCHADGTPSENHTSVRTMREFAGEDVFLIETPGGECYTVTPYPELDSDVRKAWKQVIPS